jgi:hypothetical protein
MNKEKIEELSALTFAKLDGLIRLRIREIEMLDIGERTIRDLIDTGNCEDEISKIENSVSACRRLLRAIDEEIIRLRDYA